MKERAWHTQRKNLMVDNEKLKRLQRVLKVASASEAVRVAVERTIEAEEAIGALQRLKERGTWGTAQKK